MKIAAKDIPSFVKTASGKCQAALLYGPDNGLIRERMKEMALTVVKDLKDPFNVAEIFAEQMKDDSSILHQEMAALSFTGERRLILLRNASDSMAKPIEEAFSGQTGNSFLIAVADDLPARSALRALFERDGRFASLPCYHDEGRDLESVIASALARQGFAIDREALVFVTHNLGSDRRVTLSELEKLMLYMGENKRISLEDIMAVVGNNTEISLEDVASAVAGGAMKELDQRMEKLLRQDTQPVALLRAVLRYFLRLYQAQGMVEAGLTPDQAMEQLRPAVFFKQKPAFRAQLMRWDRRRIVFALGVLRQAERQVKSSGARPELVCSASLMKIARLNSTTKAA